MNVGRRVHIGERSLSALIGAGFLRTVTDFGAHGGDPGTVRDPLRSASWEPWLGGTLSLELAPNGVTVEVELGSHRVRKRYYAVADDTLVRDFQERRVLVRVGVAFPF